MGDSRQSGYERGYGNDGGEDDASLAPHPPSLDADRDRVTVNALGVNPNRD
jgi:hypothetical protein